MDGQYVQLGSATPFVRLQFISTVDGSNVTTLVFNTASLAISYARDSGANVATRIRRAYPRSRRSTTVLAPTTMPSPTVWTVRTVG